MLLATRPPPKPVSVGRALREQCCSPRKPARVTPNAGHALMRFLDEILEISFPRAVVVRHEQQLICRWQQDPAREVNNAGRPEKAWPRAVNCNAASGPQADPKR